MMFLHSGAGLHGHEYSTQKQRQQPNPQAHSRPFPLLRSALRSRSDSPDLRGAATFDAASARRSLSGPLPSPDLLRNRPLSEALTKKELAVRFVEPEMDQLPPPSPAPTNLYSEGEDSVAASDLSDSTDVSTFRKRRKRAPRQSTRYAMAQPAPQHRTRQRMLVQFRPRLLLQLQRLDEKRPIPMINVVPSSTISGSIILPILARRFPRVCNARPDLGPDDLLLVRAEDYNTPSVDTEDGHQRLDDQDLLGVVSPLPHQGDDHVEIALEDGSVWASTPLVNGSYEFTKINSDGTATTARWVKRAIQAPTFNADRGDSSPLPSPAPVEYKYTFSVINPSTRRHPILGVLKSSELEIFDSFSTMSTSSGRYPPTRPISGSFIDQGRQIPPRKEDRAMEPVSEEHKKLMAATAIWIGLRQIGWPASANPKTRRVVSHCQSSLNEYAERGRRSSWFSVGSGGTVSGTTVETPTVSRPPIARNNGSILDRQPECTGPRRAMSTGAQFMRRRRMNSVHSEDGFDLDKKQPADAISLRDSNSPRSVRDTVSITDSISIKDTPIMAAVEDESTITCRSRLRRLTQRLFRRGDTTAFPA